MDATTLDTLRTALDASPGNTKLRTVVVRGLLDTGRPDEALALVKDLDPAGADAELQAAAARACLASGEPERALLFAPGDDPESLVLRARACLALDRNEEGRQAYDRAVALNPGLEDMDLKNRLSARVRSFPAATEGGPRLRVIEPARAELDTVLAPPEEPVTFADVGGLEEIKDQVRKRIILPFQKPSLFQKFKKRVGGGLLMYGPPGCGKTLLARATAGECKAKFYNVAISDILDMYIGESESKLHALFEKARSSPPAVIFFDELEALGGKRQYSRESLTSKLVSQFLAEMDGFSRNNQGVLILGATNVPWNVDSAFLRPGRFDRFLFVPPPDRAAREVILKIHLADRPTQGDLDLGFLAGQSGGFSGADLRALVESGADEAIEETLASGTEKPITAAHLKAALRQAKPTTVEWLTTARNYARYSNESGQYDEVLEFLGRSGKA
jgi:transitional endoplasmic reticulum ATPase